MMCSETAVVVELIAHGSRWPTRIALDLTYIKRLEAAPAGCGVVTLIDGQRWPIANYPQVLGDLTLGLERES